MNRPWVIAAIVCLLIGATSAFAPRIYSNADTTQFGGIGISELTVGGPAGAAEVLNAEAVGRKSYENSFLRKVKALAISGGPTRKTGQQMSIKLSLNQNREVLKCPLRSWLLIPGT